MTAGRRIRAARAIAVFATAVAVISCGGSGTDALVSAPAVTTATAVPDATAAPEATVTPDATTVPDLPFPDPGMTRSAPVRVRVPAIAVDETVVPLGLNPDGALQVPAVGNATGWYSGSPTPGETGPAVLVGHVDWKGQPGVFYRVRDLTPGASVTVTREDGTEAAFTVNRVVKVAKNSFPTAQVYGNTDLPELRLVTCGGKFDRATGHYEDNILVFAKRVPSDR